MKKEQVFFSTKVDMIYSQLKEEILNGEIQAGQRLILSQIAQRMGVSEIPVREAIKRLESDYLVDNVPHVGAKVKNMSDKDFSDIYDIRASLEGTTAYLAANAITESGLTKLEELMELAAEAHNQNDWEKFGDIDNEFHNYISKLSGNDRLYSLIMQFRNQTKIASMVFRTSFEYNKVFLKQHRQIFEAIVSKDSYEAMKRAFEHRMYVKSLIVK